ncbi:MAG: DUF1150 family protein [Kiloniellales bacterium]
MYDVKTIRNITQQDFAALGLGQVAYVRPMMIDGHQAFAVHAANGRAIAALASDAAAQGAIRENDLEPVALH